VTALSNDHHQRIKRFVNELTQRFGKPASITLRPRRNEMEYDNTNRGVLFNERDRKVKDGDRDYAGSINVNGVQYWLSAWIKTSQKGVKFMSLSIKPKVEKPTENDKAPGGPASFDDEVPFSPEWRG
jgi:hypothetical protein